MGQCSMTVALPILSACGHETCILPTALLSTHTGGFGKPSVIHFDGGLESIWKHWQENKITFDAILVGYLGSISAVEAAAEIMEKLLAPGGVSIVDPAMADHGKRYSGLSEEYADAMKTLCRRADIILPNITEAAMMADVPYREKLDSAYVDLLLDQMKHPCVVLTGVSYEEGKTGVLVNRYGNPFYYTHEKLGKRYHGTGDMFAAAFTGALMQEKSIEEAVQIAADFTYRSIANTAQNPAHWYGVKFETALPYLIRMLDR